MKRENRYIVLKKSDVEAALSPIGRDNLGNLCWHVDQYREKVGKAPLVCAVVESDWPEYEHVWELIRLRVEKATIPAETVQTIVDVPAVDAALRSFYEDATNDNAFFLVRSIMEACLPSSSAPQVEPEPEPAPEGYFAYSDDAGYEEFDTAEEAKDRALTEIDLYREDAADGWPEQVDNVCWGIIVQRAKGFDQQDIPTDDPNHTYQTCDYRLEPVIPAGGEHGN